MAVHLSTIAFMPKENKPNWPTPVPSGRYEPGLCVSKLSAQQKNSLWLHLKSQHPQKAMEITEIMNDPIVSSLMRTFDGSLVIEREFVPESLLSLLE
ncbi:Magnesium transporter [Vibrio tubiashii]